MINHRYGNSILCFEMEAAGIMNALPCLVVRGISDYADSRKNDEWRPRAIAGACSYAKALILHIPREEVPQHENLVHVTDLGKWGTLFRAMGFTLTAFRVSQRHA